jgi:eukaryotic-like serine/threonine-protein kinase
MNPERVLSPGTYLGPYEILAVLGEGGMGTVYHARRSDDVFHKDVAIKVVKRGLDSDAILRRFQRERRILARLEHPSVARVLDGGSDAGQPYLVMEYVDGRPLPEYANAQQLDLRERLRLFVQICEAVQHAHDRQIVHRDLKPGNILVDESGRPRLLDFGIATLVGTGDPADRGMTMTTGGPGLMTPRYASPEQMIGAPIAPASDQYSLGMILSELLAGCGRLDDDLDRVLAMAKAKEPADRYASVSALAADINRYLDAQPVHAMGGTATHRARALARRHRGAFAAALVAAIAILGAAVYMRSPRSAKAIVPPGKVMLAVLPLENLTGNEERGYFVDGLHEEIISRLGRLQPSRLGVIARTSVLQYKGTSTSIAQIGRELGAGYILEGSVREAGPTVRITAQLIQVSDQTHLWTETYDRQFRDLFTVQSEIGAHVADSLTVGALPDALAALDPHDQLTAEADAAYMRGRYFWNRRALNYPANAQLAADHFRSVAQAAPAFAPAPAALGQALHYLSRYSPPAQRDALVQQSRAALSTALTLDSGSAAAEATLAIIKWRTDWDWTGAEDGFRRALAREPNNAEVHQQLGWLLSYGGRHDEGQREMQLALELDPLSPTIHDAAFYLYAAGRRWDKAQEMTERLARLVPDDSTPVYQRSLLLALRGECGAALDDLRRLESRGREMVDSEVSFYAGYVFARCDRQQGLHYVKNLEREPNALAISMAEIWAGMGDRENTLRWLEECVRRREQFITYIAVDPMLAPFRDDPRFAALLRQINYPTQWSVGK